MDFENICNTGLSLGLGSLVTQEDHHQQEEEKKNRFSQLFPAVLTLGSSSVVNLNQHEYSISASSSFANSTVKKEGDVYIKEEKLEYLKVSNFDDQDDEEGGARKKLRLTKEQSIILEESFKDHNSLNPKQKHALAKRLNLRARQVEVWFQNRRARTKLKQTEVECELLKKCCQNLTQENKRLHKELQELRAFTQTASFDVHMSSPTLTMCPSCERISSSSTRILQNSSKSVFRYNHNELIHRDAKDT